MISLIDILKIFRTNYTPSEREFQETWKSFWHKSEKLPQSQVLGLNDSLNDKASKADLANATTNFKGYHTSLVALQAKNKKDFFAWVGSPYPGTVYKVFADGGTWTNTGEVPTQQEIDLAEYAKKAEQDYTIYWELGKTPTIRQNSDNSVTVSPLGTVYVRDYLGKEILSFAPPKDSDGNITSYTILTNQLLIIDIDNKAYKIIGNGNVRPDRYVVLANNQYGMMTNGRLVPYEALARSSRIGIIINGTTEYNKVNWDTQAGFIEFDAETNIRCGNKAYAIDKNNNIIDLSTVSGTNTFHLFFDCEAKRLFATQWDSVQTGVNIYYLFSGRKPTKELSIYNYSIDGISNITSNNWSIPNYQLVYDGGLDPIIEITGSTINITIRSAIYVVLSNGLQYKKYSLQKDKEGKDIPELYSVPANKILILDLTTSMFKILGNNDERKANYVLMASSHGGVLLNGQLRDILLKRSSEALQEYNLVFGYGGYPNFNRSNADIIVDFNADIYIVDRNGNEISNWKYDGAAQKTFKVSHNQVLILDIDKKEIKTVGVNSNRPYRYVNLLQNSYGNPNNGQLIWAYIQRRIDVNTPDILPVTVESRYSMKTNKSANQDLTVVGQELWHFNAAPDDNSSYASIYRWNIETFEELPIMQHNLGHAASCDYLLENDAMLVGNGTYLTTVLPRLDIILNVSKIASQIDVNSDNVLSIPFFTNKKQIDGTGLIACWGEHRNQIYLFTGQNAPRTIYRVLLGMGENDYSDKTADEKDLTAWGAFIPDKSKNEFNGTAKILSTHRGVETGLYQGCCFRDGYIWLCCGTEIPYVLKLKCYPNGTYRVEDKIELPIRDDQDNALKCEPEGVCIDNNYLYMGLTVGKIGIAVVPIYGRQGGIGHIGEKIMFDFKVNHNPNVQISPLSAVTDLYIDSIDCEGFTVKSASNGNGKFNWTSCLN